MTDEIDLLVEVSNDISFALDSIQKEQERIKSEIALQESEIKYKNVTQSANDAIITANTNSIIIGWNQGAEKIFGYSEEEIIGKDIDYLIFKYKGVYYKNRYPSLSLI